MMEYEFTGETLQHTTEDGEVVTLRRVYYPELKHAGGWIESKSNLSQGGKARVLCEAKVYGDAYVGYDALVTGQAEVFGDAGVMGIATVCGSAKVYGYAVITDDAYVACDARIYGRAIVSGIAKVQDSAVIRWHARVGGRVQVGDCAVIEGDAKVQENAEVFGNAVVQGSLFGRAIVAGDAVIGPKGYLQSGKFLGKANIQSQFDAISFCGVGRENGVLTMYRTSEGGIEATRGCFQGTIEEFVEASKQAHGCRMHEAYKAMLAAGKLHLDMAR